jgi:5-methyltetrahydrofolate--homocysteine methyltransferase
VPLIEIVNAAREHKAHAIGMSGLLVKSNVVMRENLEEMSRQGVDIPVLLGGAALTRNYVEDDCVRAYASGRVAYARDAFDGLHLMDKVMGNGFDDYLAALQTKRSGKVRNEKRTLGTADPRGFAPVDLAYAAKRRHRVAAESTPPAPPFWGARVLEAAPKALVPFINERSLYQFQWGFRKAGRSLDDFLGWAKQELRPVLKRMLTITEEQNILKPQAIYGYWKCAGQGNDLILFAEDGVTEVCRFNMPRQPKEDGDCIADFVRDVDDGPAARDVIGLQVVTMGRRRPISRASGSRKTAIRITFICTVSRWKWRKPWPNTSISASAPNGVLPIRMNATSKKCSSRAIAAGAIPLATRPARSLRIRKACSACSAQIGSAYH